MDIELKKIDFSYQDGVSRKKILDKFSLTVNKGDFLVILGPSGCGKSTLLNIMGGLLRPDSGTVLIGDIDYYTLSKRQQDVFRKMHMGYVFQKFYLIDDLSPADNIMLTMQSNLSVRDKQKKINEIAQMVGISEVMNSKIKNLSGGEQQRLAIARAVAQDSDILICDEPTGNLDEENSIQVMSILSQLNQAGKTIIVVTHNKELCVRWANRIINLSAEVRFGGKYEADCTNCME